MTSQHVIKMLACIWFASQHFHLMKNGVNYSFANIMFSYYVSANSFVN